VILRFSFAALHIEHLSYGTVWMVIRYKGIHFTGKGKLAKKGILSTRRCPAAVEPHICVVREADRFIGHAQPPICINRSYLTSQRAPGVGRVRTPMPSFHRPTSRRGRQEPRRRPPASPRSDSACPTSNCALILLQTKSYEPALRNL
jgi:hypothetical protein